MRWSTLVVRGRVDERLPGVKIGCCTTEWVGTPTRIHVTELLHAADPESLSGDPIVLQSGGTADSLTVKFEGDTVFEAGTDVLVFAADAGDQPGDPSDYWVVLAAEIDRSGRLVNNGDAWPGTAPFLVDATIAEISDSVRSMSIG